MRVHVHMEMRLLSRPLAHCMCNTQTHVLVVVLSVGENMFCVSAHTDSPDVLPVLKVMSCQESLIPDLVISIVSWGIFSPSVIPLLTCHTT